jgi:hypothetical protein
MMPAPGVTPFGDGASTRISAGVRPLSQGTIRIQPGQGVLSIGPDVDPEDVYEGPANPVNPSVPTGQAVVSGETICALRR